MAATECQKQIGSNFATYQGNGAPQQRFKNGGNPSLQPETAKVATVGAVFEPVKGLALTAASPHNPPLCPWSCPDTPGQDRVHAPCRHPGSAPS